MATSERRFQWRGLIGDSSQPRAVRSLADFAGVSCRPMLPGPPPGFRLVAQTARPLSRHLRVHGSLFLGGGTSARCATRAAAGVARPASYRKGMTAALAGKTRFALFSTAAPERVTAACARVEYRLKPGQRNQKSNEITPMTTALDVQDAGAVATTMQSSTQWQTT